MNCQSGAILCGKSLSWNNFPYFLLRRYKSDSEWIEICLINMAEKISLLILWNTFSVPFMTGLTENIRKNDRLDIDEAL